MSAPFDAVLGYAFGTLDATEDADVERRLFDDPALLDAAMHLLGMRDVLCAMAQAGPVVPVITPAELTALASTRHVWQWRPPGTGGTSRLPPEAEFVAARLPVDLSGADRLDVEILDIAGNAYFRTHEAPFDRASGEVIVLCQRHVALAAGVIGVRVRDQDGRDRGTFHLDALAA